MPQSSSRRMERRVSMRADAQLSMRLGGPGETAPEIVTETQNISSSGVYCVSPHYLAPLSKVDLTLVLPEAARARAPERLVQCEAVVVRCQALSDATRKRYQLACSFLGLADDHRRLLDDFVALRNLKALHGAASAAGAARRASVRKQAAAKSRRTTSARRPAAKAAATRARGTVAARKTALRASKPAAQRTSPVQRSTAIRKTAATSTRARAAARPAASTRGKSAARKPATRRRSS